MGLLMVKVGGEWVPYVVAGTVTPPAYAGPEQSMGLGAAQFTHLNAKGGWNGFNVYPDGAAEVDVGTTFVVYKSNPPLNKPTTGNTIATFDYPRSVINGWKMGPSSAHALAPQLLPDGWAESSEFSLLAHSTSMIINGCSRTGDNVSIRVGNVSKATFANVNTFTAVVHEFYGGQLRGHHQTTDFNYYAWPTMAWGAAGQPSFMGVHAENTAACAFRIYPGQGEAMYAVNSANNQHTPVGGSAWVTISSLAFKEDVRSLRPERERIVVRRDPKEWSVETPPDIMALRPVSFFPKGPGAIRPVKDADGEWTETEPYPDDNWVGHDSRRERLGLIAEEVQEVIPSCVHHDEDGNALGIDYAQIMVALLDHVQRLTDEVATLRYRIAELENA